MKKIILASMLLIAGFLYFSNEKSVVKDEAVVASVESSKIDVSSMVGQMIMVGFRGETLDAETEKILKDLNVGGVLLFDYDTPTKKYDRNIESPEQLMNLVNSLQNVSDTKLFIAVDAEGGLVNRLKPEYGFISVPSHQELGSGSIDNTKYHSERLAEQLLGLGINVNFAPVVDVNINPDNPIIGGFGRSFSEDPEVVTAHANAFIEGQKKYNILPVIKHFPGHGSSKGDTHKGVVDVTDVYDPKELIPFTSLINSGSVDAVMSAHIVDRNVDQIYPASLSKNHIDLNLRKELGFDGLVFSDDIDMRAISEEFILDEIVELAINAGVDVIVSSNNVTGYNSERAEEIHQAIMRAVDSDQISVERITESYDRITKIKEK